jgi:hypothetical protein
MSSRKPEGLSGIQKNRPSYKGRFFICEVTEFLKLSELYLIPSSEEILKRALIETPRRGCDKLDASIRDTQHKKVVRKAVRSV